MQLGREFIELTEYLTPKEAQFLPTPQQRSLVFQHIAIAVSDMDKAYQHLQRT